MIMITFESFLLVYFRIFRNLLYIILYRYLLYFSSTDLYVPDDAPRRIDCGLPSIPGTRYSREYYIHRDSNIQHAHTQSFSVADFVSKLKQSKVFNNL